MYFVVADTVHSKFRSPHEVIYGPSILPVNTAVSISTEHSLYVGFIDRKESVYHILGPMNPSVADHDIRILSDLLHESWIHVRCYV